jgi:pyridoxine 5-phosphate synthase
MRPDRPVKEFNIEGYPEERLMAILRDVLPEQCTLVPDAPDAFTSEEGWKLDNAQASLAHLAIAAIKALGCRVILFIDPDPAVIPRVGQAGADGVEIYTGRLRRRVPRGHPCRVAARHRRHREGGGGCRASW